MKLVNKFGFVLSCLLLCSFFVSGCSVGKSSKDSQSDGNANSFYRHRVKYSGETLGIISQWYTGSIGNWGLIEKANPGLRPTHISIGEIIYIPQNLIVKHNPLTKAYVSARSVSKVEKEKDVVDGASSKVVEVEETDIPSEVDRMFDKGDELALPSSDESIKPVDDGSEIVGVVEPENSLDVAEREVAAKVKDSQESTSADIKNPEALDEDKERQDLLQKLLEDY